MNPDSPSQGSPKPPVERPKVGAKGFRKHRLAPLPAGERWKNWLTIGFAIVMVGIFVAGAGAIFLFYHFSRGLPDYHQLATYDPPVMSRVYAGDGRLIQEYAIEGRVFVPISAIPKRVSNAFIASEDQRFYTHPGIDVIGLSRAAFEALGEKLIGSKRRLKGASTITQQVAQNFLLGKEYTVSRKVKEVIL